MHTSEYTVSVKSPIILPLGSNPSMDDYQQLLENAVHSHSVSVRITLYRKTTFLREDGTEAVRFLCPLCPQYLEVVIKATHLEVFIVDTGPLVIDDDDPLSLE